MIGTYYNICFESLETDKYNFLLKVLYFNQLLYLVGIT